MVLPSPEPRRVATPKWLDTRLVLGIVLVLASVLIGALVFSRASRTYATVAATHDLAAGTILRQDDLEIVQSQLPDHGNGVYLDNADDAVGKKLSRPVSKGELLPSGAVAQVAAQTTVTVAFAAGAAPDLRAGQRIEVWVSTTSCASVVLLPDVTVQMVSSDTGGSFSSGTGGQNVVISVGRAVATRVVAAQAIDQVQIRAGVLVGGGATPSASSGPPAGATRGGLPADLAACVSDAPTS